MEGPNSMNAGKDRAAETGGCTDWEGAKQTESCDGAKLRCRMDHSRLLFGRLCVQGKGRDQARENQLHVVERVEREKDRPNGTTPPGPNNSGTSVVREGCTPCGSI